MSEGISADRAGIRFFVKGKNDMNGEMVENVFKKGAALKWCLNMLK
ncbi:hypothetical protein GA0061094_3596 [[Bacillus] enclensis]|jgi:hypothetical protein|uniref:Uncharacterized protein n=1 Tax=[Bacillus] enclensis TaxID=1402860 RepID=A0A1C4D5M3_9BACI|nr:hypothetical protein GA0061094_3596 [[Bacillus] enclensis]